MGKKRNEAGLGVTSSVGPEMVALERMRSMTEEEFRRIVVAPLLQAMGTHVTETHGVDEEGKDFTYMAKDHVGFDILIACQVKNEKLTGDSSRGAGNVTVVLNQLLQCVALEALNPVTNLRERPQAAYMISTYPLPDGKTKSAGRLLAELREKQCQFIGPEKLIELLKSKTPHVYEALVLPGQQVGRAIGEYVALHREAEAFGLSPERRLSEFFVDLDAATAPCLNHKPNTLMLPTPIRQDHFVHANSFLDCLKWAAGCNVFEHDVVTIPGENERDDEVIIRVTDMALDELIETAQATVNQQIAAGDIASAVSVADEANSFVQFFWDLLNGQPGACLEHGFQPVVVELDSVSPEALLCLSDDAILVAEVGSGKTSLARAITAAALRSGKKCVYFPCYAMDPSLNLTDNMTRFVHRLLPPETAVDLVRSYLNDAELIVIDGLDEAPDYGASLRVQLDELLQDLCGDSTLAASVQENADFISIPGDLAESVEVTAVNENTAEVRILSPVRRLDMSRLTIGNSSVRQEMEDFESRYRAGMPRLFMTTRDDSIVHFGVPPLRLTLQPFTDVQLDLFFTRWFPDPDQRGALITFLNLHPHIKEACRRPMVATLVATMHGNGVSLPRSRSELYDRRFDLLFERWDKAKGLRRDFTVTPKDKKLLLSRLALEIHSHRKRTFTLEDFAGVWSDGFHSVYEEVTPESLLEELRVGNGVVLRLGSDEYSLGHLSFQEFLAANGALHTQDEAALAAKFSDPWWREVLVFYAGLRGDVTGLIGRLQRISGLRQNQGLLDEMLAEARFTSSELKAFVKDAGAYLDDESDDYPDRDALTWLGEPEIEFEFE